MDKKSEKQKLFELRKQFKEMYLIVASAKERGYSYAKAELLDILDFIDIQLAKEESSIVYEDICHTIIPQYKSMFPPKAGLSEFHIWHEDEKIRIPANQRYDELKQKIEQALKINRFSEEEK